MKADITIKRFGQPRTRETRAVELKGDGTPIQLARAYVNDLNAKRDTATESHEWELLDVVVTPSPVRAPRKPRTARGKPVDGDDDESASE